MAKKKASPLAPTEVVKKHPNGSLAAGLTGPVLLVIWLGRLVNVDVPPEVAVIVTGAIIATALFVGKRGIRGIIDMLWRGGG